VLLLLLLLSKCPFPLTNSFLFKRAKNCGKNSKQSKYRLLFFKVTMLPLPSFFVKSLKFTKLKYYDGNFFPPDCRASSLQTQRKMEEKHGGGGGTVSVVTVPDDPMCFTEEALRIVQIGVQVIFYDLKKFGQGSHSVGNASAVYGDATDELLIRPSVFESEEARGKKIGCTFELSKHVDDDDETADDDVQMADQEQQEKEEGSPSVEEEILTPGALRERKVVPIPDQCICRCVGKAYFPGLPGLDLFAWENYRNNSQGASPSSSDTKGKRRDRGDVDGEKGPIAPSPFQINIYPDIPGQQPERIRVQLDCDYINEKCKVLKEYLISTQINYK
jgi:hypothetical protein